jgi:hypothetical protein
MMKSLIFLASALLLASCDIYIVQSPPAAAPLPTAPLAAEPLATPAVTAVAVMPTSTEFPPAVIGTATSTEAAIQEILAQPLQVEILGCDTGFDLTHGMYEVTNAYVAIRNAGADDLVDACVLLRAVDEDRQHPDKRHCISTLPAGFQVTTRLTVDSTFRSDTAIQVDLELDDTVGLRISEELCRDISVLGGPPTTLDVIVPLSP